MIIFVKNILIAIICILLITNTTHAAYSTTNNEVNGEKAYQEKCAVCHDEGVAKAPRSTFLRMLSPDRLEFVLTTGVMSQQAKDLKQEDRHQLIQYLTGSKPGQSIDHDKSAFCEKSHDDIEWTFQPKVANWGIVHTNSRLFPASVNKLTLSDFKQLKLDWSFVFPGVIKARSQPSVAWKHIFVGSADGRVYALRKDTGCISWTFHANAEIRTAVTPHLLKNGNKSTPILVFGDLLANVYAINAKTGKLIWQNKVDDHPSATVTGSPHVYQQQIFVPISSLEVTSAADPNYSCCTFRGSVAALDLATGKVNWKSYTILQPPKPVKANVHGVMQLGPSGSPVWNSPTIDVKRKLLYFGTGENYSSPADHTSDAIFALSIDNGDIKWIQQKTQGDAWNMGCVLKDKSNCPEENGPDVDFAASVHLHKDNQGVERLIAGQKSGVVYALDPNNSGKELWRNKLGKGGIQGGVHFGFAANKELIFIPISDYVDKRVSQEQGKPGLYAIDAKSGKLVWSAPAKDICGKRIGCSPGISSAISATNNVVIAGSMDGVLRIYDSTNGNKIWQYDSTQTVKGVNGVTGKGGSFGGGAGPVVNGKQLIITSGYGLYGHMPGNVLLIFSSVDDKNKQK